MSLFNFVKAEAENKPSTPVEHESKARRPQLSDGSDTENPISSCIHVQNAAVGQVAAAARSAATAADKREEWELLYNNGPGGSNHTENPISSPSDRVLDKAAAATAAQRKEWELRAQAVQCLTRLLADKPNGTTHRPPVWYRRPDDSPSSAFIFWGDPIFCRRPRMWIKDWETGIVRPRIMMDDMFQNNMERERRQAREAETPSVAGSRLNPIDLVESEDEGVESPSELARERRMKRTAAKKTAAPGAGASGSRKRKAIDSDESEAEQDGPASRVRVMAKKRRRLDEDTEPSSSDESSEYCSDGDDSERGFLSLSSKKNAIGVLCLAVQDHEGTQHTTIKHQPSSQGVHSTTNSHQQPTTCNQSSISPPTYMDPGLPRCSRCYLPTVPTK